ncbi:MAG: phosphoesterase [Desulfurococcaceae archaeon]
MSEKLLADFLERYKSFTIIPDTSLDSLLCGGVIFKKLIEHGFDVKLSLDSKILIDYPDDPALTIGLPSVNSNKQLALLPGEDDNSSLTGLLVLKLDKLVGVDKWDKLSAIIAGLYKGLYDFKAGGFKGVENSFLKDLINDKVVVDVAGLRLWGSKRLNLATALYRTLMPFIPGVTGNIDKSMKIVSEVFKTTDPLNIRQKELRVDEAKDSILLFLKTLTEQARDPQLAFKLLGDFYINLSDLGVSGEIEANELMGSLVVLASLCRDCPFYVSLLSMEKSIILQAVAIYDEVIDDLSRYLSSQIDKAKRGEAVEGGDLIKRPDIIIDVLRYINALPKDKAVKLTSDRGPLTVLRELIRIGVKPEEAYSSCEDDQICPTK